MSDKMQGIGDRVASRDKAYQAPMSGIVSRIAQAFDLPPAEAGKLLCAGLVDGRISVLDASTGDKVHVTDDTWFEQVDWSTGSLRRSDGTSVTLVVYWPNVEAAAGRQAALKAIAAQRVDDADEGMQAALKAIAAAANNNTTAPNRTGPRPNIFAAVEANMRAELAAGLVTREQLLCMKKIELPLRFGGGETTCLRARKSVLGIATNSARTTTNDK